MNDEYPTSDQAATEQNTAPNADYAQEWRWLLSAFRRPAPEQAAGDHKRSHKVALTLSLLLGWTGLDRFYLGKVGTGILKMITLGGLFIWWLIDIFLLASRKTRDVNGLPLEGADDQDTFTYLFLTVFGSGLGVHYFYLGFKRLGLTRLAVSIVYMLVFFWYNSNPFYTPLPAKILFWPLLLVTLIWGLVDLYLAITGRIRSNAEGTPLAQPGQRYQSICLLLAFMGGFFGMDRFYLGHRVLGIIKLFTLGGLFTWYFLDIVLAILNVHKDSEGRPMLQE